MVMKRILAIVQPVVLDGQRSARQHFLGPRHVQSSGRESGRAFYCVELDRHY